MGGTRNPDEQLRLGRRILRRPAFAAGLIEPGGGPAHFDQYNNVALVLCGKKRFFIAPHEAMRWVDLCGKATRPPPLDLCGIPHQR